MGGVEHEPIGHAGSDRQVVLTANRALVVIDDDGSVRLAPGGLAAALIGVGRRVEARWVACARPPAERILATAPTTFHTCLRPGGPAIEISYVGVDPVALALRYQSAGLTPRGPARIGPATVTTT